MEPSEKGYFNILPTQEEVTLVRYIGKYVETKEPKNRIGAVRLAKIIVHVVLKNKLPVRLFWYDMGIVPGVQPQIPATYDLDSATKFIDDTYNFTGIEKINASIDEARMVYSHDLTSNQIRRKQYEELNDQLYLAKLDLEEFTKSADLYKNRDQFLDLLSKMILCLPSEVHYSDFNKNFLNFTILARSLLDYTKSNSQISDYIKNALFSFFEHLNALCASYKKVPGYEKLFTGDTAPKNIKERQGLSQNSLVVLQKVLSDNICTNSVHLDEKYANSEMHKEFMELLLE
jgi:hypothetical protein